MAAVANIAEVTSNNAQLTNISVNSRIDYILRFNKQVIAVIGQDNDDYASVCSQFLTNLSNEHNAAYITVTSQLQDIQIRSRIIEQLFANALFDPEQSLAINIVNLIKNQPQKIAIAVEHAQHLSIQLLHELVQLAELAKKSKLTVDIVIVGSSQLGLSLTDNTVLFKNKISLLSAETGQLLSFNSSLFKPATNFWGDFRKPILLITMLSFVLAIFGGYFYFNDKINHVTATIKNKVIGKKPVFVVSDKKPSNKVVDTAKPIDIVNAIEANQILVEKPSPQVASPKDVLHALAITNQQNQPLSEVVETLPDITSKVSDYGRLKQGYVIQYAAFSDERVKQQFLARFPKLSYLSYYREINGQQFEVLTSPPMVTRKAAQNKLASLPDELKALKVWIKTLAAVKTEINQYQSSQS